MKQAFSIILFFNSLLIISQVKKSIDVFEDAYVVTLKGDTIRGYIKLPKLKKVELYQKISFKDKSNKVRLFTPDKIRGYGYNSYYYMSAFHENKSCFFKLLSKGEVSLFQIQYEVIEDGDANIVEEFCVMENKKDAQFKVIDGNGVKKQLKDIFKSNKTLVQKISEQKEIAQNAETLESYFKEFNQTAKSN